MFFDRKRGLPDREFFSSFRDVHSHILYGVDDGIKELSESLDVLNHYQTLGIRSLVLTPHINVSCNDWELVESHFEQLKSSYSGDIELSLAGEYMIDSGFSAELKRGLRAIKDDMVLIESSYLSKSANFEGSLYDAMNMGYTPVIAHPERYLFMEYSKYGRLKDCDYKFQLNLLSLSGLYGKRVKQRALQLLEDDMYDFIGSDLHNLQVFKQSVDDIKLTKAQLELLMALVGR